MTLYNIVYWGFIAVWVPVYILQPIIINFFKQMMALCKPVMFSYQHVVVTGGGTGLGKTLV